MENGTDYRTLVKAYAIRFDVLVNGNVSLSQVRSSATKHALGKTFQPFRMPAGVV